MKKKRKKKKIQISLCTRMFSWNLRLYVTLASAYLTTHFQDQADQLWFGQGEELVIVVRLREVGDIYDCWIIDICR